MERNIAVFEFIHESNTFASDKTSLETFLNHGEYDQCGLLPGEDMMNVHTGIKTGVGACIEIARKHDWKLIPTIAADTVPSGEITSETYGYIIEHATKVTKEYKKIHGVFMHLHGASAVEGITDANQNLLKKFREVCGEVPIVAIFDLHANLSEQAVALLDIALGYNEEPHTDIFDRGLEAGELLNKLLRGEISPVTAFRKLPMILPAINMSTSSGPMQKMFQLVYEQERNPKVINASVFGGFYGSDRYDSGPAVLVTTDGDIQMAESMADDLYRLFMEKKNEFFVKTVPVHDAVKKINEHSGTTVVIDEADDPAGGGPGDGTFLFHELRKNGIRNIGISSICDGEIIEKVFEVGEGGEVYGLVGGKKDNFHGEPIKFRGTVKKLRTEPIPWNKHDGTIQGNGRSAVISFDDVSVIVSEKKLVTEDLDAFGLFDISSSNFDVIIAKGLGLHIRESMRDITSNFITVDGKGITDPNILNLKYRNIRPGCFPFYSNNHSEEV